MAARKNKTELSDSWKDKIKVSMLMNRLIDHYLGKLDKPLDQSQIKAAEVVLARLVPTLSAVEQTNLNPQDQISEAQLISNLQALLVANPDILPKLIALQAKPAETHTVSTELQ